MPKIQLQLKLPLLLHHPNSLHHLLLHPHFAVRYCIRIRPSATVSATSSAFSRPLPCPLPSPLLHPHSAVRYCVCYRVRYCIRIQPSATASLFSLPLLHQYLAVRCCVHYCICVDSDPLKRMRIIFNIRLYLASEVLARSIT